MTGFREWLRGLRGSDQPVPDPSAPHARTRPGGPQSFAEDNNEFALAMYGLLRQRPGNLTFSPFSIRAALGMTQAGARGETAAQMREALCVTSPDETLHAAFSETVQRLNSAGGGEYELAVANSLWGQEGAPLQPDYVRLIARHYRGAMKLLDFRGGAEAARTTVNRWVEDATRQKIRELIPPGGLDADTRLVLANAVYFRGLWTLPFDEEGTREEPFHLDGGGRVQAPLMRQQDEVRHVQAGGYQAVDLIYRGGDLSMLVLLPDRKDGLRDLEKTLSAHMLHDCVAQTRTREVKLFLPRFKITWGTADVRDQLTALGMPFAFSRLQADFSGINGHVPPDEDALFIAAVYHQALVEVNEEGTEAAAATAGDMRCLAAARFSWPPPIPVFRADHPFLFAIRDRRSGTILFLGRIEDPTRES